MPTSPAEIARRAVTEHLATRSAADLLARFNADRDADAFAGLVSQFGPLVMGVCRRVLGPSSDADDAFQAVFVALARQAAFFRDAQALPAWLHRVALRTARKTLARRASERLRGLTSPGSPEPIGRTDPFADVAWRDVRRVLDEELDRLPEKLRGPVVLCWLDGLTQDEAAGRLGLSLNTLKRRLDAGRELLRARLVRRGVAPVLVAATTLDAAGLRASVSGQLTGAVVKAALAVKPLVGGVSRWLALAVVAVASAGGLAMVAADRTPTDDAPQPRPVVVRAEPEAATVPLPPGAVARYGSEQFRVPDRIDSAALSPDGKLFAIGGPPVRLYESATWKPVRQFTAGGDEFAFGTQQLAFSPNGRYLAGLNGRFVYIWDIGTSKLLHSIDGKEIWNWSQYCTFTPDNLLAISDKKNLLFIDPANGREVRSVPGGNVIALSPDGRQFARHREGDRNILIFGDVATGKELFTVEGLAITNLTWTGPEFSPDGKSFVLLPRRAENEVEVWDVVQKERRQTFRTAGTLRPTWLGERVIGFTADGKTIFAREKSGDIIRWDVGTGQELSRLRAGNGPPLGGLYALPDGKTLLTTSIFGWVRLWDAATGEERPVPGRYWDAMFALAPDGKLVAIGDRTGRLDLLDAATGKLVRTIRETGVPVVRLVFSPDSALLAIQEAHHYPDENKGERRVRLLRVSDGKEFWSQKREEEEGVMSVSPLGFAAGDGDNLILAYYPKGVRVWDTGANKELHRFDGFNAHAAPSPDGKLLATDDHGEILLIDLATGREKKRLLVDPGEKAGKRLRGAALFAWDGSGRRLATTLPEAHVCLINPATGKEQTRFRVYTDEVPEIVKPFFQVLMRNGHGVRSLALSPDGKRLAASSLHGWYVAVWDAEIGKQLVRLDHGFQVDFLAFTPDGKGVVTFGRTGLGYRWDIEKLIAGKK